MEGKFRLPYVQKISILKNHVNGIEYKDGKIIAVPQGFIMDTKESLEGYKKQYSEYWNKILGGTTDDYTIIEGDIDIDGGE